MAVLVHTLTVAAIVVVVAMLVAVVIKGMVLVLGRGPQGAAPADPGPARPEGGVSAPGAPPPHHVAIIAAAVSAVFDEAVVVHIEPGRSDGGWASTGRSEHHQSHSVRFRP